MRLKKVVNETSVMQAERLKMFAEMAGTPWTVWAKVAKVPKTSMFRIIHGQKTITEEELAKLAKVSTINPEWLMTGRYNMSRPMIFRGKK